MISVNCPEHHRRLVFEFRVADVRYFSCPGCPTLWSKRDSHAPKSRTNVRKGETDPIVVPLEYARRQPGWRP